MKVHAVQLNNRKKVFEIDCPKGKMSLPYSRTQPMPTSEDPVVKVWVDPELGMEGFTYTLRSGEEGAVLGDQFLDYNCDPDYLRMLLLHRMTVEAKDILAASSLSKREVIRRLGTSPSQFYRLMDQTNYNKSIDKMIALLAALDHEVDFTIRPTHISERRAAEKKQRKARTAKSTASAPKKTTKAKTG